MVFAITTLMLVSNVQAIQEDSYRLSTDDEISITVFDEPDLSISKVKVSSTGAISLPLIGQVLAKDLTITDLEKSIENLLLDGYLKKPNVTISITEYRPFYINGEVNKPGGYPFRQGLTVQTAVTLAGGFTERASKTKITLSNKDGSNVTSVDLKSRVRPGDVITVSESFF